MSPIYLQHLTTPIGILDIAATEDALVFIDFQSGNPWIQKHMEIVEQETPLLSIAKGQLEEYFAGTRKQFDLPLSLVGSHFQIQAWHALSKIPYGETRSYGEQAAMISNPLAVRAIGGANNRNPFLIIIPCHRIIGKNGSLTGYRGGIERKKWLLKHEKQYQ